MKKRRARRVHPSLRRPLRADQIRMMLASGSIAPATFRRALGSRDVRAIVLNPRRRTAMAKRRRVKRRRARARRSMALVLVNPRKKRRRVKRGRARRGRARGRRNPSRVQVAASQLSFERMLEARQAAKASERRAPQKIAAKAGKKAAKQAAAAATQATAAAATAVSGMGADFDKDDPFGTGFWYDKRDPFGSSAGAVRKKVRGRWVTAYQKVKAKPPTEAKVAAATGFDPHDPFGSGTWYDKGSPFGSMAGAVRKKVRGRWVTVFPKAKAKAAAKKVEKAASTAKKAATRAKGAAAKATQAAAVVAKSAAPPAVKAKAKGAAKKAAKAAAVADQTAKVAKKAATKAKQLAKTAPKKVTAAGPGPGLSKKERAAWDKKWAGMVERAMPHTTRELNKGGGAKKKGKGGKARKSATSSGAGRGGKVAGRTTRKGDRVMVKRGKGRKVRRVSVLLSNPSGAIGTLVRGAKQTVVTAVPALAGGALMGVIDAKILAKQHIGVRILGKLAAAGLAGALMRKYPKSAATVMGAMLGTLGYELLTKVLGGFVATSKEQLKGELGALVREDPYALQGLIDASGMPYPTRPSLAGTQQWDEIQTTGG